MLEDGVPETVAFKLTSSSATPELVSLRCCKFRVQGYGNKQSADIFTNSLHKESKMNVTLRDHFYLYMSSSGTFERISAKPSRSLTPAMVVGIFNKKIMLMMTVMMKCKVEKRRY
jgi:hypothetical protein